MPHPQSTPQSQPARKPFAPAPGFSTLQQYIQAAAVSATIPDSPYSSLSALFHLVIAIFTAARAATRCLVEDYNDNPRQRTFDACARLRYCLARIPAIFHTIRHAPERFLRPTQLRALTRAQAVLAHIWDQPVDFAPLTPYLTAPENCPPPPRSVIAPAASLGARASTPAPGQRSQTPSASFPGAATGGVENDALASSDPSLASPRSTLPPSPEDPLLLRNPGRALASVLLQLAALYGLSAARVPAPPSPSPAAPAIATPSHADSASPASAFRSGIPPSGAMAVPPTVPISPRVDHEAPP